MSSQNKRYLGTHVEAQLHKALIKLATQLGEDPSELVALAIEELVFDRIKKMANPDPELALYLHQSELASQSNIYVMLTNVYTMIADNPQDEDIDKFNSHCRALGVEPEDISERASKTDPEIILESEFNISNAITWLEKKMKRDAPYPASSVIDAALSHGFSKATITSARKRLGITSTKPSKTWVWTFPSPAEIKKE